MNRTQWTHPDLQSLVRLFFQRESDLGEFTEQPPESLPELQRSLLAHTSHMTVTMEDHHQSKVDVHVLDRKSTPNHYSRKILLSRQSDQQIVQFGIVRLSTAYLEDHVRKEIETESTPLGRILIQNDVLRTVKLMSTWEIQPSETLKHLVKNPGLDVCYGRTALIYTDGIPAVELLEIVVNV